MKTLHRTLRVLSAVTIAICSVVALGDLAGASTSDKVKVTRVVDGDTIVVNGSEKVRLMGIDTPETVHPWKAPECGGPEASAFTKRALTNRTVTLKRVGTDKYGRTLAYVFKGKVNFNLTLIQKGLAYEYTYRGQAYEYHAQFKAAATHAAVVPVGLWANC